MIYVIRTSGNPFASRPSRALLITTLLIVAVGVLLPLSRIARPLGFVPFSGTFYLFVAAATLMYLISVQLAKGWLLRRAESPKRPHQPVSRFAKNP